MMIQGTGDSEEVDKCRRVRDWRPSFVEV
jgi:hypothetical protein